MGEVSLTAKKDEKGAKTYTQIFREGGNNKYKEKKESHTATGKRWEIR